MNLSLDIKLKIALRLPKYIQHQLINDSPVGVLCCNEVFKSIRIVPTSSRIICIDFDERLHKLNCIKELAPFGHQLEEYVEVPHYGQLKQKFPYTPNRIIFDTLYDLLDFYATYGEDIYDFQSIRIGLVFFDNNIKQNLPRLNNITNIGLGRYDDEDMESLGMFKLIETLRCDHSTYPLKVNFPNLKTLKTADSLEFSSLSLESLWFTDAGGRTTCFDLARFPKTLRHLTIDLNQSSVLNLNLSQFPLETLIINGNETWDMGTCVLEEKLPTSLRKLELGLLGGDFKMAKSKNFRLNFRKLEELILKDISKDALVCFEAPNLVKLGLHRLKGLLERLSFPRLSNLILEDVQTPEDFEFLSSLSYLTLIDPSDSVIDLRSLIRLQGFQIESKETKKIHPAANLQWFIGGNFLPFRCPDKLLSLHVQVEITTQIKYNESIKDLELELKGAYVDLAKLIDLLPEGLLSLLITHKSSLEWSPPPDFVDLSRFKDLVALELNGLKLSDNKIKFPPQLVKLDLFENDFERIPQLSELTLLSMVSNSLLMEGLKVPPKLKFLDLINNRQDADTCLDFSDSSLEYLNLACYESPRELALPATMKVLYLDCDVDDLDWIDALSCTQLTVIHQ